MQECLLQFHQLLYPSNFMKELISVIGQHLFGVGQKLSVVYEKMKMQPQGMKMKSKSLQLKKNKKLKPV